MPSHHLSSRRIVDIVSHKIILLLAFLLQFWRECCLFAFAITRYSYLDTVIASLKAALLLFLKDFDSTQEIKTIMDAIKTFFLWPVHIAKGLLVTLLGWTILILPCIFRFLTKGKRGFSNNLDIFAFMDQFPLGAHCFSTLVPFTAPYSGSVEGHVSDLSRKGDVITCSGSIENLPWLRNPFQSVHAIAMTNM
jgi:hypothetical protein